MTQNPENPSAGKFEPPPPPRDPMARPPFYKRWWFTPLIVLGYIAKYWFESHKPDGDWVPALSAILVVGLAVVQYVRNRVEHDEHGEDNPYSPPTQLTR